MATVTADFISGQINHWISTPQNSYLGSNYGIDLKQYLHKSINEFDGDAIIAKMRHDIPVLQSIGSNNLNIYFQKKSFDKICFYIDVNGLIREFEIA